MWIVDGLKFGSESGQCVIVKKSLYTLKSSGAVFRAHLAETIYEMCYKTNYIEQDVCFWTVVNTNGFN